MADGICADMPSWLSGAINSVVGDCADFINAVQNYGNYCGANLNGAGAGDAELVDPQTHTDACCWSHDYRCGSTKDTTYNTYKGKKRCPGCRGADYSAESGPSGCSGFYNGAGHSLCEKSLHECAVDSMCGDDSFYWCVINGDLFDAPGGFHQYKIALAYALFPAWEYTRECDREWYYNAWNDFGYNNVCVTEKKCYQALGGLRADQYHDPGCFDTEGRWGCEEISMRGPGFESYRGIAWDNDCEGYTPCPYLKKATSRASSCYNAGTSTKCNTKGLSVGDCCEGDGECGTDGTGTDYYEVVGHPVYEARQLGWEAAESGSSAGFTGLIGEGDCDSDSQCARNFKCGQRNANSALKGVYISSSIASTSYDFCYDPNYVDVQATNLGASPASSHFPLQVGEGDCDNDDHCASGLKCCQRNSASDSCTGLKLTGMPSNYDFCYEPMLSGPFDDDYGNCVL
jgi:hypothetical protein